MRKADEHLMQVLQMLDTVEWETQQMMVLEGLKTGNSILNEMHKVRLLAHSLAQLRTDA